MTPSMSTLLYERLRPICQVKEQEFFVKSCSAPALTYFPTSAKAATAFRRRRRELGLDGGAGGALGLPRDSVRAAGDVP